jgi:hypothetical protein
MTSSDPAWQPLHDELAHWSDAGRVATLWWRDDDAVAPTAALDRMLALVDRHRAPLGLAVIPSLAQAALADRLRSQALVDVLQHGFAHVNHAGAGERAAEFGAQRSREARLAELALGWQLLASFPRRQPIFVPPWNRYDIDLAGGLAAQGLQAISAFGPARRLPSAIVECNCHVDIISWRTSRGFAGLDKTVRKLVEHLEARRSGIVPPAEATGLLTHHLVHDDGCWAFLVGLFERLDGHEAVRWLRPLEAAAAAGREAS